MSETGSVIPFTVTCLQAIVFSILTCCVVSRSGFTIIRYSAPAFVSRLTHSPVWQSDVMAENPSGSMSAVSDRHPSGVFSAVFATHRVFAPRKTWLSAFISAFTDCTMFHVGVRFPSLSNGEFL